MKAFTEAETQSHLTAQFRWVPFVARLLGEGPLRGSSDPLELRPDAVNQESLTAIKAIMNRAVWRFLARECGWTERRIVTIGGDLKTCRLWQQEGAPAIRFSDASVELLLTIYNGTRGAKRINQLSLPDCHHSTGDLLLHHLIFLRLKHDPLLAGSGSHEDWTPWLSNPLNALKSCVLDTRVFVSTIHWEALFSEDLRPYIPWILARIKEAWLVDETQRWVQDTKLVSQRLQIQAELISQMVRGMEGADRPDLIAPVLEYFHHLLPRRTYLKGRFDTVTRPLSMRDRTEVGKHLSDLLSITRDLTRIQSDLLSLHPVEREAPANLFLSAWEELDFTKTCCEAGEFRRQITPTLT